ncbi:MAG: hypothetical protein H5U07_03605 [Candidatus Aminicenantes bacterium]|nr:hypothetical protein [Candidatus Aminicenantes bacterium]
MALENQLSEKMEIKMALLAEKIEEIKPKLEQQASGPSENLLEFYGPSIRRL